MFWHELTESDQDKVIAIVRQVYAKFGNPDWLFNMTITQTITNFLLSKEQRIESRVTIDGFAMSDEEQLK
jgi:hypothetical protein